MIANWMSRTVVLIWSGRLCVSGMAAERRTTTLQRADPRRRRRQRRLLVWVSLMIIAAVIGGLPVYVRPQVDPLRHADAIFVIGGFGGNRYRLGLNLSLAGWAPNLVISNPLAAGGVWGTNLCATPPAGITMHCFYPDPPTTKGEGRELRSLAARYGWRTVIVVTFRPHISRARYILEQCFDGDLVMVPSSSRISATR